MKSNKITEVTRRALFDEMRLSKVSWAGSMSESNFLSRVFDLKALPTRDHRVSTMADDIWMHRDHFMDWADDWVFDDDRLNLMGCTDECLFQFLCEMLHPLVRTDEDEVRNLAHTINKHLMRDGVQLHPVSEISGRPLYAAHFGIVDLKKTTAPARKIADALSSSYLAAQINRMEASVISDPSLAIGTAKDFLETICKGIMREHHKQPSGGANLPELMKQTRECLGLVGKVDGVEGIRNIMSAITTLTQGIAEVRGYFGSGHGHDPATQPPPPEVAKLAVGAATTLGVFLFDWHRKLVVKPEDEEIPF